MRFYSVLYSYANERDTRSASVEKDKSCKSVLVSLYNVYFRSVSIRSAGIQRIVRFSAAISLGGRAGKQFAA